MAAPALSTPVRRGVRLEQATIAYNALEGVLAVAAGLAAGLVSLIGFGVDSAIEVAAAAMVLARLTAEVRGHGVDHVKERRALRFIAVTFFGLTAYVVFEGSRDLLTGDAPDTSVAGIAITATSIVLMPLLARVKQRTGEEMGSRLLIADAAETRLCAWLSVSTFVGLAAFSLFGWTWLDAAAGFVIACFAVKEGREAWAGEIVCEDGCASERQASRRSPVWRSRTAPRAPQPDGTPVPAGPEVSWRTGPQAQGKG